MVLQDNGVVDEYVNDQPGIKYKWEILGKEVHIGDNYGGVTIARVNADTSLTVIAVINDGKREEVFRDNQITFKRINQAGVAISSCFCLFTAKALGVLNMEGALSNDEKDYFGISRFLTGPLCC